MADGEEECMALDVRRACERPYLFISNSAELKCALVQGLAVAWRCRSGNRRTSDK
jgi:hypothetical protein